MSSNELPLWARGAAAALLLVGSWWLSHTVAVTDAVGSSVATLSLGVLAVSIIAGMGVRVGLWPVGEWRERFLPWVVVGVAIVFALLMAVAGPASFGPTASVDRGTWVIVIAGVLGWGFVVAVVPQRPYVRWYVVAILAAFAPYAISLIVGGSPAAVCLWTAGDASSELFCDVTVVRSGMFFGAAHAAGALLTYEFAFRRLLIGDAEGSGLALVLSAATVAMLWGVFVAPEETLLGDYGWMIGLTATAAGCLYVLSGSLLVSSLYTGLGLALHVGMASARDVANADVLVGLAFGGLITWIHVGIAALLCVLVIRNSGILGGIR